MPPFSGTRAMSSPYESWVGREERYEERILPSMVNAMAATLDLETSPQPGDPLPAGWHWMFFNPVVARRGLGSDGHPKRGGFLPPIELPRRMWAGSRIRYLADVPVDAMAHRVSRIHKVENKTGKRGLLWFVTVSHTTSCDGVVCIEEEQDIVYREAPPPSAVATLPEPHPEQAQWGLEVMPDSTLLFRYSALTFNGHRIHYDQDYARHEEGYPDLVVHGPLTATLLQQLAQDKGGRPLSRFEFRGVNPLFAGRKFRVEGRWLNDGEMALWARGPSQELAMSALATLR
jgi:3-methylfumaryl-CoA hydratase